MPILMFGNQPIGGTSWMEGIPSKTLAQAEYNLLSEEEKSADILYIVTDVKGGASGPSGSFLDVYDGEEIVVGTWFGKPLYRRSFEFTTPNVNTATSVVNGAFTSECKVLFVFGALTDSDGAYVPVGFTDANGASFSVYVHNGNIMSIVNAATLHGRPAAVAIEYTKEDS